jgi:hypothetical protein
VRHSVLNAGRPSVLLFRRYVPARGLAPRISAARHSVLSAGRPSVLLFRRYISAWINAARPSMLLFRRCVPVWRLRRYQSSPMLECVQRAGRINAWRSRDELDHLLQLEGGALGHNLSEVADGAAAYRRPRLR